MSGELFGRKMTATIAVRGKPTQRVFDKSFSMTATVKRTIDGKTADTCNFRIYNADDSLFREYLLEDEPVLTIAGGYPDNIGTIFTGDIIDSKQYFQGTDKISDITAGDGSKALSEAVTFKGYAPKIGYDTIVSDLIDSLKEVGGVIASSITKGEIPKLGSILNKFGTLSGGKSSDVLDKILKKAKKQYTINNGVLNIFDENGFFDNQAILLTPENGLLDSPKTKQIEKTTDTGKKKIEGVEFNALLMPGIVPGQRVRIKSRYIDGEYVVQECSINMSSRGDSWNVSGVAI